MRFDMLDKPLEKHEKARVPVWGSLQVKECKLARATSVLVDETAGQVATKDRTEIAIRDLQIG